MNYIKFPFTLWATFIISLLPMLSLALTQDEIADKVISQFSKLPVPNKSANTFEKWSYDTSGLAAIHCWQSLKKGSAIPVILKSFKPTMDGSWRSPENKTTLKLCESLANKGIKPICTHSILWAKNVKRRPDLPLDYLQVYKNKPLEIEGTLGCYLNVDQVDKQIYAGSLLATWSEKPVMKSINLADGPKNLEAGTLIITAPHVFGLNGNDYREPRLTIVISE